jgi:uncharacterized protein with beta-barrel porin domain
LLASLLASTALCASALSAAAQDATWLANPGTAEFNNNANWNPAQVPTGTAFFDTSTKTTLTVAGPTFLDGFTFNAGAPAYTFNLDTSATLRLNGAGIVITGGSASLTTNGFAFLEFHNGATAATATITNNDGAQLYFYDTSSAGGANITNNGGPGSAFQFNGNSTAANATIINNWTMAFVGASSAGAANITTNAGSGGDSLQFFNNSTASTANITANAYVVFWDSSTAANSTININNQTTTFTGSSTAANATLNVNNINGGLDFGANATAANAIITNNGLMQFRDSATAGSSNITNNLNLGFFGASTAGNAAIVNNGLLGFANSNFTDTASAGSATITNNANGNLVFAGLSTASSTAITNAGVAQFFGNSTAANATIANAGTLLFFVNATTGNAIITSTGSIQLDTTDTTGAAAVTLNAGGSLIGSGTIGNTTVNAGGTIAPGNSIGLTPFVNVNPTSTIAVNGNLTFNAGSTYGVAFSPTAADRINVAGQATLNGVTVQAFALPGSFSPRSYTILNATGGITGTFASLVLSGATLNPEANRASLSYDANDVYLVLAPGTIQLPPGTPGNQSNVANGINNAILNGATPPGGFDTLLNLNAPALINALAQVSGEGGNGAVQQTSFTAVNQFIGTMLDPSIDGRGSEGSGGTTGYADEESEALSYARKASGRDAFAKIPIKAPAMRDSFNARWSVWAAGFGGSASVDGNAAAGTHSTSSSIYGTAVGADYRPSRDTLIGFAMGGGGTSFSTAQALGRGRADLFQAGLYGRHSFGAAYVAGALAYGWQNLTIDRTVTVAGTDQLRSRFNAHTFAARAEAGYRFATALSAVTPYGALQSTTVYLPGYAEFAVSGSNQFALAFASQTTTNVRSELGLRGDKTFVVSEGTLTLRDRIAWAHDSNTNRSVSPTFQSLPGASFSIQGARPAADGMLLTAGAEMKWKSGWALAAKFEGEFSRTTDSYAGQGTVKYTW